MSCNGCRVLRKGCNENCILRESLEGIDSPQSQANATVFVAKFFGRAGLMSFISSVPESQRPALFQSLLFEACGRTLNPVNGAVGLLWTGNWHLCQSAVETVLRGGVIRAMPELCGRAPEPDDASEVTDLDFSGSGDLSSRRMEGCENVGRLQPGDLQLGLKAGPMARMTAGGRVNRRAQKRRATTPSMNSEESETTTMESGLTYYTLLPPPSGTKLLRLFL